MPSTGETRPIGVSYRVAMPRAPCAGMTSASGPTPTLPVKGGSPSTATISSRLPEPGSSVTTSSVETSSTSQLVSAPRLARRFSGSTATCRNSAAPPPRTANRVPRRNCSAMVGAGITHNPDRALGTTVTRHIAPTVTPHHATTQLTRRNGLTPNPCPVDCCRYLGGEEVNSSPSQGFDRYVISFHDMSLAEEGRTFRFPSRKDCPHKAGEIERW